jgi:heme-degrading monooxygenase HmoA
VPARSPSPCPVPELRAGSEAGAVALRSRRHPSHGRCSHVRALKCPPGRGDHSFGKGRPFLGGDWELIVDVLEYRVVPGHDAELAGYLRHGASPALPTEGQIARFVGWRLREGRENLAATLWSDERAFANGTDSASVPHYLAVVSHLLGDRTSTHYRVVASTGLDRDGAKVLRLYRTALTIGSIAEWERQASERLGQLARIEGLLTGVAGVEAGRGDETGEARVVVITTWTEWNALLSATGGRLSRPLLGTELPGLERAAVADHFELVDADRAPA